MSSSKYSRTFGQASRRSSSTTRYQRQQGNTNNSNNNSNNNNNGTNGSLSEEQERAQRRLALRLKRKKENEAFDAKHGFPRFTKSSSAVHSGTVTKTLSKTAKEETIKDDKGNRTKRGWVFNMLPTVS